MGTVGGQKEGQQDREERGKPFGVKLQSKNQAKREIDFLPFFTRGKGKLSGNCRSPTNHARGADGCRLAVLGVRLAHEKRSCCLRNVLGQQTQV